MNTLSPLLLITPVMLVLAVAMIGFVIMYQRRMLQHQEYLRHLQLQKQHQLLEVTLQAQEEERRRVARDLHDEVGAMLALVKLNLHQLTSAVPVQDEQVLAHGYNIKQQLDEIIGSVRRISHDLMPVVLEKMGLAHAFDALKRTLATSGQVTLQVSYNEKNKRIDPKLELLLYRMVQELLNNTLKHAQATQVSIDLAFGSGETKLLYADNGVGFDMDMLRQEQQESGGLGIMSLQSRAALMDGHIQFSSAPGEGFAATVTFPMPGGAGTTNSTTTQHLPTKQLNHGVPATNNGHRR